MILKQGHSEHVYLASYRDVHIVIPTRVDWCMGGWVWFLVGCHAVPEETHVKTAEIKKKVCYQIFKNTSKNNFLEMGLLIKHVFRLKILSKNNI